ncbi:MAG: acylneuraminate cytidylyltransferase family protein [Methyloprofundus sp.]|nr:acylneuraminate cytidylyltransferase family protein [Methyloprofundus sp.]
MGSLIALIPARAYSKRFPGKNKVILGGKPLFQWTLEAAVNSQVFDKVVLSSDSQDILNSAKNLPYDSVVTDYRPAHLASDQATAAEVLMDYLEREHQQGIAYDLCSVLLPTSPFRTANDIVEALALLKPKVDSVVSMQRSHQLPQFLYRRTEQGMALLNLEDSLERVQMTRSQDNPDYFYPNGAIYIARTSSFLKNRTFYGQNLAIYEMPTERSIDIDYPVDLAFAEFLLARSEALQ